MVSSAPLIPLNSGTSIPQVGFGVFLIPPEDTQRAVEDALEVGYRHIDTATAYRNEAEVGAAVRASGLPREEVFVTTKLRNDDHAAGDVEGAFERSLQALDLGYIDLYLIHWPMPRVDRYVDTWRAFDPFRADGRARSIGVSNFHVAHLERIIAETGVTPAMNQVELHPTFQQRELRAFHAAHGIQTEAWAPLGQGRYDIFNLPPMQRAAAAHGVTPAQVVLRWHLQTGIVALPKSSFRERMRENLDITGFELSADEMAAIDALDENKRLAADPDDFNS
ncbi:aldo/keto reductase [Naasia sp. SYSU D00948]|uniref:aldo/keto reductase n=1 Tax=Naasia sp. SYSU D00948 TaxID=2817379 RepID=UPI001B303348|nr:aldo/keto reductase [Naasia sp. SYSU D00948]